jgi:hypothetical protein
LDASPNLEVLHRAMHSLIAPFLVFAFTSLHWIAISNLSSEQYFSHSSSGRYGPGGSAAEGSSVPDWGYLPAFLLSLFCEQFGEEQLITRRIKNIAIKNTINRFMADSWMNFPF